MKRFQKYVFWPHLVAGILTGSIIFIMAFTGTLLSFEPQILAFAERHQRHVQPPSADAQPLSLTTLMEKAIAGHSSPTNLALQSDPTATVAITFGRNGVSYLNPYTGDVVGARSKIYDAMHQVEEWHRWLGSREVGRPITGISNLLFLFLAVSGLFLWWPRHFRWTALKSVLIFRPGLRGKHRDWNWHNVIGFWCAPVLIILTLTGTVMSFSWANALLYTLTGNKPPPSVPRQEARGPREEHSLPAADWELLKTRASEQSPGWTLMNVRFPQRDGQPVTVSILGAGAVHPYARSQLSLGLPTLEVQKWEPYTTFNEGKKVRSWVRALHTGEAGGVLGQLLAGLASTGALFLVWTGFAMSWHRFKRRTPTPSSTQGH